MYERSVFIQYARAQYYLEGVIGSGDGNRGLACWYLIHFFIQWPAAVLISISFYPFHPSVGYCITIYRSINYVHTIYMHAYSKNIRKIQSNLILRGIWLCPFVSSPFPFPSSLEKRCPIKYTMMNLQSCRQHVSCHACKSVDETWRSLPCALLNYCVCSPFYYKYNTTKTGDFYIDSNESKNGTHLIKRQKSTVNHCTPAIVCKGQRVGIGSLRTYLTACYKKYLTQSISFFNWRPICSYLNTILVEYRCKEGCGFKIGVYYVQARQALCGQQTGHELKTTITIFVDEYPSTSMEAPNADNPRT